MVYPLIFTKGRMKKMKKFLCFVLAMILCLSSMSALADVEGTVQGDIMLTSAETEASGEVFNDIVPGSVLGEAVNKLVSHNILSGYGDGTFRPNNGLTRAELSKIINLVFNLTEKSDSVPFKDVAQKDWYYDHVAVAVKAGYINGFEDNTFRGNDPVTREQVCAIINRVTKEQGMGLFDFPFTTSISDPVSDWALEDVKKIVSNYVMPLEAGGKFRAKENITRAELVLAVEMFVIEAPEYIVTFETNGGDEMEAVLVKQGSTITKPSDPVKKNNTFKGWFTDKALKKQYDFATFVTEDITLYAKWVPNSTVAVGTGGSYTPPPSTPGPEQNPGQEQPPEQGDNPENPVVTYYTIAFNSKGGSDVADQYVASGECAVQPDEPVKDFCVFAGWFKDSALTTEYDFSSAVTKNMTLYAKWEEDTAAITAQRVSDLTVIKEVMSAVEYTNIFFIDIKDMTLETINMVITDGTSGTDISGNYVSDTYGDRISEAKEIYDNVMTNVEREEFKNSVIEMISVCQSRGIKMTLSEIYQYFWEF